MSAIAKVEQWNTWKNWHKCATWTTLAVAMVALLPVVAAAQTGSPAEQRIAAAERMIALQPGKADGYNDLALALARRARETANTEYYSRADVALAKSLAIAPDNFEARKLRAWVLLGQHEFARALDLARELNKQVPDDLLVYGFLTDAYVELGRYKEAEESCQWMLDLRPGNVPALTRAAYLRELFGDVEGAIELMTAAFQRTPPTEIEDRAWMLTQLGHLETIAGRLANGERALHEALRLFPEYHYALAALAKVRLAQTRHDEAVGLLQRRYAAAPHPENLYAVGDALAAAGRQAEARAAFAEFEAAALRESAGWDNANRELIFYYANHARKPKEALRIAELEIARRQDVYTRDAYAWALRANGRLREAREEMRRALDVGMKDPDVVARAAVLQVKTTP